MESITKIFEQLAKEIAQNNEKLLQSFVQSLFNMLNERYFKPLHESRILKNKEVAKRLNVCPATVTQLIDTGKLSTTADGRVTEYHLLRYITYGEQSQFAQIDLPSPMP